MIEAKKGATPADNIKLRADAPLVRRAIDFALVAERRTGRASKRPRLLRPRRHNAD